MEQGPDRLVRVQEKCSHGFHEATKTLEPAGFAQMLDASRGRSVSPKKRKASDLPAITDTKRHCQGVGNFDDQASDNYETDSEHHIPSLSRNADSNTEVTLLTPPLYQRIHNLSFLRYTSTLKKTPAYLLYDSTSFESAALITILSCSAVITRPLSGRMIWVFLESWRMGVDTSVWNVWAWTLPRAQHQFRPVYFAPMQHSLRSYSAPPSAVALYQGEYLSTAHTSAISFNSLSRYTPRNSRRYNSELRFFTDIPPLEYPRRRSEAGR
jgi:hypothetical protein